MSMSNYGILLIGMFLGGRARGIHRVCGVALERKKEEVRQVRGKKESPEKF